jgi:hypothetical protein
VRRARGQSRFGCLRRQGSWALFRLVTRRACRFSFGAIHVPVPNPTDEPNRCNLRALTPKTPRKPLHLVPSRWPQPLPVVCFPGPGKPFPYRANSDCQHAVPGPLRILLQSDVVADVSRRCLRCWKDAPTDVGGYIPDRVRLQSCRISSQSGSRSASLRAICLILSLPPTATARLSQSRAASSCRNWQA